jgi:hypothetical protein
MSNIDCRLRHFPGLSTVGTSCAIKDILTIMGNQQMVTATAGRPVINGAITKMGAHNFAGNSSDLKALNLLHDDLIIPCQRRKLQLSGFVATFG